LSIAKITAVLYLIHMAEAGQENRYTKITYPEKDAKRIADTLRNKDVALVIDALGKATEGTYSLENKTASLPEKIGENRSLAEEIVAASIASETESTGNTRPLLNIANEGKIGRTALAARSELGGISPARLQVVNELTTAVARTLLKNQLGGQSIAEKLQADDKLKELLIDSAALALVVHTEMYHDQNAFQEAVGNPHSKPDFGILHKVESIQDGIKPKKEDLTILEKFATTGRKTEAIEAGARMMVLSAAEDLAVQQLLDQHTGYLYRTGETDLRNAHIRNIRNALPRGIVTISTELTGSNVLPILREWNAAGILDRAKEDPKAAK
jgi:hypothetical protein